LKVILVLVIGTMLPIMTSYCNWAFISFNSAPQ
jgi:hypothetical protein